MSIVAAELKLRNPSLSFWLIERNSSNKFSHRANIRIRCSEPTEFFNRKGRINTYYFQKQKRIIKRRRIQKKKNSVKKEESKIDATSFNVVAGFWLLKSKKARLDVKARGEERRHDDPSLPPYALSPSFSTLLSCLVLEREIRFPILSLSFSSFLTLVPFLFPFHFLSAATPTSSSFHFQFPISRV